MSSMYDLPAPDLGVPVPGSAETATAVPVQAPPRLRVVPDVPLDFDAAIVPLTPRLVRYATRRLGDRHEAEEVVQEALLRAYKHRAELLTEDDLAAWSTCVTGRLVIDRLRVRGRSTSVADVPEGTRVGRDTADVVVARDEARTALDALDAMPPRQAAVLWAREVEGLAYEDIGARFGMTEPAVRSILTRARKALRKEYTARGGTLPAGGLAAIAPWADGLGWLERLRGAMGRMTAPAALSVVGVGLLGGALLLPGGEVATPPQTPAVAHNVVALDDSPAVLRLGDVAPVTAPASAPLGAPRNSNTDFAEKVLEVSEAVGCHVHETQGIVLPGGAKVGGEVGVGNGGCAGERASTTYVDHELPVVGYVGITSDRPCSKTLKTVRQTVVQCIPSDGGTQ